MPARLIYCSHPPNKGVRLVQRKDGQYVFGSGYVMTSKQLHALAHAILDSVPEET